MPYFIQHALVALAIQITLGLFTFLAFDASFIVSLWTGSVAGATFYISREVRDWEKLGFIDYEGFLYPVGTMLITFFVGLLCK